MDVRIVPLVVLVLAVSCAVGMLPQMTNVHTKFEFKYSFKGPYLIDSKGNIPFWNYYGSRLSKFVYGMYHCRTVYKNDMRNCNLCRIIIIIHVLYLGINLLNG